MGHRKWSFGSAPAAEVSLKELEREHGELYDEWKASERRVMETLDENNRLDRELDEARQEQDNLIFQRNDFRHWHMNEQKKVADLTAELDEASKRIAELKSPIRVPFSDAQIERMAVRLRDAYCEHYGIKADGVLPDYYKDLIRAALAAGGLEPCAVPEYDPDDVALRPSDDEVEKLARVMLAVFSNNTMSFERTHYTKEWMAAARAAIAHLRPTQGHVLRDRLVDAEAKIERQRAELKRLNALVAELRAQPSSNAGQLPPADQVEALARVLFTALHGENFAEQNPFWATNETTQGEMRNLARAAIAHLSTRPEGLPTAEELHHSGLEGWHKIWQAGREREFDREIWFADYYLTALRPWLRDPVGCQLDVTEREVYDAWGPAYGHDKGIKAVIDLCRSRIRCKECAGLKQRLHHAAVAWRKIRDDEASDALDAALEGE